MGARQKSQARHGRVLFAGVCRHPLTGEPAWFCNVPSHSRYLRDKRDGDLPETSGSSKLNRTNMFYGDLSEIDEADLREIDDATMRNLVHVPMQQGDVVLVDNYQARAAPPEVAW